MSAADWSKNGQKGRNRHRTDPQITGINQHCGESIPSSAQHKESADVDNINGHQAAFNADEHLQRVDRFITEDIKIVDIGCDTE